jgi:cell division protein FtsL
MNDILLTVLIVLQMIVMLFILYTSYRRYKYDKSFWEKQDMISEEFLKQARAQSELLKKGAVACEQEDTDKE